MKLHENLLLAAKADKLSHFYIVETNGAEESSHSGLVTFVHHFIKEYYQKIEGQTTSLHNLMDHPDVLVLGLAEADVQDEKLKNFSVQEAESFARFFEFKPVQSKRKFAVITQGHRITPNVANKWLKLFEEPTGLTTIFLLNPRGQKFLDTVHSRAIHLRLPHLSTTDDSSEWEKFLEECKDDSLSNFLEKHTRAGKDLGFWVGKLITWESEQLDHSTPKCDMLNFIKSFEEMEIFHQPLATKWTLFYSYIKEHVLPRYKH